MGGKERDPKKGWENDCIIALGRRPKKRKADDNLKRTDVKVQGNAGCTSWCMVRIAAQDRGGWTDSLMALSSFWRKKR